MNEQELLRSAIGKITLDDTIHAKWLNSLSYMENCGARKISRFEDPIGTDIIVLKHAAEEARHAYYLKKLMAKLKAEELTDYRDEYLVAPVATRQYLNRLDVATCKYLKERLELSGRAMMHGAYLLVTYSIEVRADMLYGLYQEALSETKSKVNVKSIIAEEEGHLQEMERMLISFRPDWKTIAEEVCAIESGYFLEWINEINKAVA